ncbi:nucleoside phosphorylase [Thalassorhabdomicrobium marinisediminis]|uniref:Uridine phosphorylase n=1 Tax=Thalassorhabdomicrobium marinisediminis TaxID=2170577 RepID=A0A2T7FWS7_9RHOB|nr:nucleoside phosphorylase [Thalassorhabdomicrobium marinisediminis]PVA06617.1 uridine phosphorylase [Thalassorhabdomicrobium marinisediminis]
MTQEHTPIHPGGKQMHLHTKPGEVARYVLMPGDPARVGTIGECWDRFDEVAHHREFRTIRGLSGGTDISACSHGVGGPSTDIALTELSNCGADTFIRVGSCAALQPEMKPGDLIIATGALRLTGTVDAYVDKSYPAVANYECVLALIEAAEEMGETYHTGLAASVDSFYAGEINPMPGDFRQSHMDTVLDDLRRAKVANFEMEAATIFTLCQLFGYRGGMICFVGANRVTKERSEDPEATKRCCAVASRAVQILAGWDEKKKAAGKALLYPSLLS